MKRYRKKICLLFAGGTKLSHSSGKGFEVKKTDDIKPWLMHFEELNIMADIESVFIFGGKSENVTVDQWIKLIDEIKKRINSSDGFVVLQGPQTMNYTACALTFAFQNLNKPIILTGSPFTPQTKSQQADPLEEYKGLGIKANLLNAIQVALSDINQVAILFGSRLISGVQAVQATPPGLNFFDSFSGHFLGRVDFGISLFGKTKKSKAKMKFSNGFDNKVSILDWHPGVDVSLIQNLKKQKIHGLIIRMHHQTVLPDSFLPALRKLAKDSIPVIIYQSGQEQKSLKGANIIMIENMSLSAVLVKLMWVLAQTKSLSKIKSLMARNLSGEIVK